MKTFNKIIMFILTFTMSQVVFADNHSTSEASNNTAVDNTVADSETYKLEINAPLVDNNVFPVPVKYLYDLRVGKKVTPAVLLVPVKLTINSSRERRLFTIYTSAADDNVTYGTSLSKVNQIIINRKARKKSGLRTFVGPNKKIYHAIDNGKNIEVDFKIPITYKNFYNGEVKVSIGSSNGLSITELCEVANSNCITEATFKIVPREVSYSAKIEDIAGYEEAQPNGEIIIDSSNVNLFVYENNKLKKTVTRGELPYQFTTNHIKRKFNPNLVTNVKEKSFVNNIDIYPVIHYMSNKKYGPSDAIIFTSATETPELFTNTGMKK